MTLLVVLLATGGREGSFPQAPPTGGAPAAPATQASALPPLPKQPADIFAAAAPLYDFSSPSLKPWHMKVSYQLYDEKGSPAEKGTYEHWWAKPDVHRSTWKREGVEHTEWHTAGQTFRLDIGAPLGYFERTLENTFLHPLPNSMRLSNSRLERQELSFGKVKLPCVVVSLENLSSAVDPGMMPPGAQSTYCFDPEHPVLLARLENFRSAIFSKLTTFQGIFLPRVVSMSVGTNSVLTATLDQAGGVAPTAPEFSPDEARGAKPSPLRVGADAEVQAGKLLNKVKPVYPEVAKLRRVQGVVALHGIIGLDGKLHDLSVVSSPDPSLSYAAKESVAQWVYEPYRLNGEPVEVDTLLNVVFNLGGR